MHCTNPNKHPARPGLRTTANTLLMALLGCAVATLAAASHAQAQTSGSTVFRCIDLNGVVSFSDTPCEHSSSKRLRIEHSLIQSSPISMAELQRLRALEDRLQSGRKRSQQRQELAHKHKLAERQASAERCREARLGLTEIRQRKRRGYPVSQAQRIDAEEQALKGELAEHCERGMP